MIDVQTILEAFLNKSLRSVSLMKLFLVKSITSGDHSYDF